MNERATSVVVGIAGGSASGKSTLAAALKAILESRSLSCRIVGMDTYFRRTEQSAPHLRWSLTGESVFDCNHIDSADNARLAADIDVMIAAADRPSVIIVEGLMVLAVDELRELCDLKLYLDLHDDVRLGRRLQRDMSSNRGFSEPAKIVSYYMDSARVGHAKYVEPSKMHADFTVCGDCDLDRIAALLLPVIETMTRTNLKEMLHDFG